MVLDTNANFLESMRPQNEQHVKSDLVEVAQSEKLMSNHSKCWTEILGIGKNAGESQHQRIKQVLQTQFTNVPSLDGTRKDHKRWAGPQGPPLRPMCNAKKGPNGNQGNLLARTVKPVKLDLIEQINTEVSSTEELLHHVEEHNQWVQEHVARRVSGS